MICTQQLALLQSSANLLQAFGQNREPPRNRLTTKFADSTLHVRELVENYMLSITKSSSFLLNLGNRRVFPAFLIWTRVDILTHPISCLQGSPQDMCDDLYSCQERNITIFWKRLIRLVHPSSFLLQRQGAFSSCGVIREKWESWPDEPLDTRVLPLEAALGKLTLKRVRQVTWPQPGGTGAMRIDDVSDPVAWPTTALG